MATQGEKTAIRRKTMSAPARWVRDRTTWWLGSVLDYGCGHGADVRGFDEEPETVPAGWDPAHAPEGIDLYNDGHPLTRKFWCVLCTYVLNVLPPEQWGRVLRAVESRAIEGGGRVVVTVRRDVPHEGTATQYHVPDDVLVGRGYRKVRETRGYAMFGKKV